MKPLQVGRRSSASSRNGIRRERNAVGHNGPVQGQPQPEEATVKEQMAYKLRTAIGKAIYRLRKSTVEPVIGIIKEVLGFRQFSLRGLAAAGGEWTLPGLSRLQSKTLTYLAIRIVTGRYPLSTARNDGVKSYNHIYQFTVDRTLDMAA